MELGRYDMGYEPKRKEPLRSCFALHMSKDFFERLQNTYDQLGVRNCSSSEYTQQFPLLQSVSKRETALFVLAEENAQVKLFWQRALWQVRIQLCKEIAFLESMSLRTPSLYCGTSDASRNLVVLVFDLGLLICFWLPWLWDILLGYWNRARRESRRMEQPMLMWFRICWATVNLELGNCWNLKMDHKAFSFN